MKLAVLKDRFNKQNILILLFFIMIVIFRLISVYKLDIYSDEEDILACIDSLIKSGKDVYGQKIPLFTRIGAGSTTFTFIYPLMLLCSIMKVGVVRVRWMLQIITIISCAFIIQVIL